jgi:thiol-disulfide isomerase/thioredoxin
MFLIRYLPNAMVAGAVMLAILVVFAGSLQASSRLPAFKLQAINNGEQIDSAGLRGQVLLINFFATWCPPCRHEIPSLIKVQEQFGAKGFSVIGLSVDEGGEAVVKGFVERMNVNYPVAMGSPALARGFGGLIGIPTSFLVDREGKIVKVYPGYTERAIFEEDIRKIL